MSFYNFVSKNTYGRIVAGGFYFIVTVLILSWVAFYNKFPLLYSDSGTYLGASTSLFPPVDRVIGYSFFIRWVTWQATTWTIVLFQNLIISFIIFMFLKLFFKNKQLIGFHLLTIVVLTLCSSLCWFSCQIMPDIFTPALVLTLIVFLVSERIPKVTFIVYLFLLFVFIISHLSNVILIFFLLGSIIIFCLIKRKPKGIYARIKLRSYVLLLLGVFSVLFIMTYNYTHTRGFRTSTSTNIFLVAKFDNTGLLKMYLDDNCHTNTECVLCKYKDSLPPSSNAFLWGSRSPLYSYKEPNNIDSSWSKADALYAPVVSDILHTPKYYPKLIKDAIYGTLIELVSLRMKTWEVAFRKNSAPYYAYRDKFSNELESFTNSLQNNNKLHFEVWEMVNRIAVIISLIVIVCGMLYVKPDFVLYVSTAIIMLGILFNAFITSTLSVIDDRYQSRIVWLVPLLGIVYCIKIVVKLVAKRQKTK